MGSRLESVFDWLIQDQFVTCHYTLTSMCNAGAEHVCVCVHRTSALDFPPVASCASANVASPHDHSSVGQFLSNQRVWMESGQSLSEASRCWFSTQSETNGERSIQEVQSECCRLVGSGGSFFFFFSTPGRIFSSLARLIQRSSAGTPAGGNQSN